MRKFDQSSLELGQIAFFLETNAAIDAERLVTFLGRFATRRGTRNALPPYSVEVVELRIGSLFGRVRARFRNDEVDIERVSRIHKRAMERVDPAVRQARAAEQSLIIQQQAIGASRLQNKLLAATLAATVVGVWISQEANADSECVGGMMMYDGVSRVEVWTCEDHYVIHRENVPAYDRLANPVDTSQITDAVLGTLDEQREAIETASRRHAEAMQIPIELSRDLQGNAKYAAKLTGLVSKRDENTLIFSPEDEGASDELILIPPKDATMLVGEKYYVLGTVFHGDTDPPILVAQSLRHVVASLRKSRPRKK